ncbi:unnamed protein product [Somion occarium]|uniref:Uncharacterized protein n=1 Tax=Somion occarium TaxID=3059160 RepID=A0ABP1E8S2_9APHY
MSAGNELFPRQLQELRVVCQALGENLRDIQTAVIQRGDQDVTLQRCHTAFNSIDSRVRVRTIARDTYTTAEYFRINIFNVLLGDGSTATKIGRLDEFIQSDSFRRKYHAPAPVFEDSQRLADALARSSSLLQGFNLTGINNRFETLLGALRVFKDFYTQVVQYVKEFKDRLGGNGISVEIIKPVSDWLLRISRALVEFQNSV